ncbi:unnamed protein product [Allacma fusca]|uniref:Uncharacterized protein n=1 Tax=Allacma fusca TaxID=39272 RepID=A0A8J2J737_9HEXA|nr:unnamed protein product [Allacma fusca]
MEGQPYVASGNTLRGKVNRRKINTDVENQFDVQVEVPSEVISVSENKGEIVDESKAGSTVDEFLARFVIPAGTEGFILEDHPGQDTIIVVSTSAL